jgi:8-oxo-dGTP pyrophosphatase MutT (NUDIX family)
MGTTTSHDSSSGSAITHAGGVVFRRTRDQVEYLLVRAKVPPDAWVFPKGHIEAGETAGEAAEREVLEEAGIRAKIVRPIGTIRLEPNSSAAMFLMSNIESGGTAERELAWLDLTAALAALTFKESKDLLLHANRQLREIE